MEKGDCALSPLICSQLFSLIPFKLKWSLRPGGDLSMPSCPPGKRPKGAKEDQVTHVKSNLRIELDFLVHLVMWWNILNFGLNLGWLWTGNWRVQMLWLWWQSIISGEFWESHVKPTWICPLWGSDREDKRRQLLCIIPKFSHGNAAKIRAQHAAITPMHGLSHIPWSYIFNAIKMRNLWPRFATWVPWTICSLWYLKIIILKTYIAVRAFGICYSMCNHFCSKSELGGEHVTIFKRLSTNRKIKMCLWSQPKSLQCMKLRSITMLNAYANWRA